MRQNNEQHAFSAKSKGTTTNCLTIIVLNCLKTILIVFRTTTGPPTTCKSKMKAAYNNKITLLTDTRQYQTKREPTTENCLPIHPCTLITKPKCWCTMLTSATHFFSTRHATATATFSIAATQVCVKTRFSLASENKTDSSRAFPEANMWWFYLPQKCCKRDEIRH